MKFVAEVSPLEERSLLSSTGLAGLHHGHVAALQKQAHFGAGQNEGQPVIRHFAGYQWNANYNWSKDSGTYVNNQLWDPNNAAVKPDGLHLSLTNTQVDGHTKGVSADVEIVANANGDAFHPGYGTYLVSAKTANGSSFADFTKNQYAIFGSFTYENLHGVGTTQPGSDRITGLPASLLAKLKQEPGQVYVTANASNGSPVFSVYPDTTFIEKIEGGTVFLSRPTLPNSVPGTHTIYFTDNSLANRNREIDALEVSQFGGLTGSNNAQFALQPTQTKDGGTPENVHGIQLNDSGAITIAMTWLGPDKPVTYSVYYGHYATIKSLPKDADITYTTQPFQQKYVPNNAHQTFHLNLWQFNYDGSQPAPSPTEVIVTNFQYQGLQRTLRRAR